MNTSYDLLSPSPPVSPSRNKDVATPTQGRKLKRLSLVSGAVFNTVSRIRITKRVIYADPVAE